MSGVNRAGLSLALSVVVAVASPAVSHALGSAFTYQGQLQQSGLPADGTCDFQFSVWDAAGSGSPPSGGGQMGPTFPVANQVVSNGLFTVALNFGDGIFTGNDRWLQVAVRCPAGSGAYTTLSPRQRLTAIPYALYTPFAGQATVAVDLGCMGCVNAGEIADGAIGSTQIEPGSIAANRLAFTPGTVTEIGTGPGLTGGTVTTNGTIAVDFGTTAGTVAAGDHDHGESYWRITGNSGTTAGTHFIGTSDDEAVELRVNGQRALRLVPGLTPSLVGGWSGNQVDPGVEGAVIAGGGVFSDDEGAPRPNRVLDDFGFVGGGFGNSATRGSVVAGGIINETAGSYSTIAGGVGNRTSSDYATVGGGERNWAEEHTSTIGGGRDSHASGQRSTIGGGDNHVASGLASTIGGGTYNTASDAYAVVAGGGWNSAESEWSTVAGGYGNMARADFAAIGGGGRTDAANPATGNLVTDEFGTVAGGGDNQAGNDNPDTNDAAGATVGGGVLNFATGPHSTVPGGGGNAAFGAGSFAAGRLSFATHDGSFVWGDGTRIAGSQGVNTFNALATGGFRFYFDAVGTHCDLTSSSGWQCSFPSDRDRKTEVAPVDGAGVLDRLATMPVQTWAYKADNGSVRHMGPMAQDFHAAFRLGENDREINTVDANGVALAAIQGLYRLLQEKDAQVAALNARVAILERDGVVLPQCNAEKGRSGR
jgi:trimeric autotransporter adhesin